MALLSEAVIPVTSNDTAEISAFSTAFLTSLNYKTSTNR